jgi:hypothetical protein
MRRLGTRHLGIRCLFLALALAVTGCVASPPSPSFSSVAARLPPVPPGEARIFFYRWLEPYETLSWTPVFLNNQEVGVSQPGAVLYRDVPPGQYTIKVRSEGPFPFQFKTVTVSPGQVIYARIESLKSWSPCEKFGDRCGDTFSVRIVNPTEAQAEMQNLRFITG